MASFVGTLNVVDAEVIDPAAGHLSVEGFPVTASKAVDASKGTTVRLAIRPEILAMDPEAGENKFTGAVESVTFLGSIVRIQVKIGARKLFFDTFNNPKLIPPRVGDLVELHFPREACLVLGVKQE